jgi:hypothetical protein
MRLLVAGAHSRIQSAMRIDASMDYHNRIATHLPSPHDDESPSLRQDIIDELSDHLASAYNRELLRGANSSIAIQKVLDRFGDPASVARRLWFDAMKGKTMTQRVLIASCLLITAASLALAGLIWHQLSIAQRNAASATAAAMQAMAQQNEKALATQQEMLKQMRDMSESIRTTRSLDWNPVSFKLTEETSDGPPLAGVSITLNEPGTGSAGGMGNARTPASRATDASGIADFGVVRPGEYSFTIVRRWDQGVATTFGRLGVEPGTEVKQRIVCPKAPLERVPVRVRAAWPADLEKQELALFASFTFVPIQREGQSWRMCDAQPSEPVNGNGFPTMASRSLPSRRAVLCGPATSMAQVVPAASAFFWALPDSSPASMWVDLRGANLRDIKAPAESMEWEQGKYVLSQFVVLRRGQPNAARAQGRRFEVLLISPSGRGEGPGAGGYYSVLDEPPDLDQLDRAQTKAQPKARRGGERGGQLLNARSFMNFDVRESVSWESWRATPVRFEAKSGQINEFTIALPDDPIAAVRERLKKPYTVPAPVRRAASEQRVH